MSQVNGSYQPRLDVSRQWLVKLVKRVLNRPLSGVALHVTSAFGSILSIVILIPLFMFGVTLLSGTFSLRPTTMEWVTENWRFVASLLSTFFFVRLTVFAVYSLFMAVLVPIKKSEMVGHKKTWSPLSIVVVVFVLIICASISLKNAVKYYPSIVFENNSSSEQTAIINNVKSSNTDGNSGSLQTLNAQESAEKENDVETEEFLRAYKLVSEWRDKSAKKTEYAMSVINSISLFPDEESQDWDLFLKTVDSTPPEYVNFVILRGIIQGAPFETLLDLLSRGHEFDASHTNTLASKLNVNQIKILENYGVDFTINSKNGRNALVESLTKRDNDDVFDYFLQKDELVFSEGVDVLKEAIKLSAMFDRDFDRVEKLLRRGAKVSQETRNWVENDLKTLNYTVYLRLKDKINL